MKLKRIMALVLCFAMVLSTMSFNVFAEDAATGGTWGGIDWTLSVDGTLTIAPTKGEPTQLANKKTAFKVGEWPEAVRYDSKGEGAAIEGWPYDRAAVKTLVIEEGVTSIGSFAVQSFTNLTGEVVIPSTVTYIGQEAFQFSTMEKLTFAKGGTENLTIAQGALKNLIIEEIEFPADRPAIYLKAWTLNNCDNLKSVTLPANVVSMTGTNMVDYLYFSTSHNSGNHSQLTHYNDKLEAITFGSEEVKTMFFTTCGNPITTIGVKGNHKTAPTVASVGLTFCTSLEAAAKYAQPGDTITLLKNTDEVVELPAGVTLDKGDCTAPNVTEAKNYVATVNGEEFTDLQEAIKAAAPSGTVTLLDDVVVDKWIMFAETMSIGNGNLITLNINGLTINGNNKTLTIKNVESAKNGSYLFYDAQNLNIKDLTIAYIDDAANLGGIGLQSGTLENVNFVGGGIGVLPGAGNITIEGCDFKTNGAAIYYEAERDNLVVTGCEFTLPADKNVILLRGETTFTNNIVNSGRTVNVVSGSPVVTGNNFNNVRLKVYNVATATIEDNTINVLEFSSNDEVNSVFGENTYSEDAEQALKDAGVINEPALSGSGTEEDPYLINNIDDLVKFRDDVNAGNTYEGEYVLLTDDIDLSGEVWTPIGTSNYDKAPTSSDVKMFAGNFDGGNHTITGLTSEDYVPDSDETGSTEYSFGLFGYVYGANISNVKLADVDIDGGTRTDSDGDEVYGSGVAALIGYYFPKDDAVSVIENCHVLGGTVKASNNMGGLIGHMDSQISQPKVDITIKNCSNAADVTTEAREAGGILGLLNSSREDGVMTATMRGVITFENCVNTGDITSLGGGAPSAGGILGKDHSQHSGQYLKVIFDGCENIGTVTVNTNGETHAAGIGVCWYSHGSWMIAKKCSNTGDVVVLNPENKGSDSIYAGGLISYGGVVELIDSTSTGTVTLGTETGNKYVGGAHSILFLEGMDDYTDTVGGYTYYLNGGTSPERAALVDDAAGGGNFHLVETAYKDGFEFGGWYDNANFTGEAYTKLNSSVKTYYAKWIGPVAKIGNDEFDTIQEAIEAAEDDDVIELLTDITISDKLTVSVNVEINGNNHTLTYTGTDRAIDIPAEATGANVTVKNLKIVATKANRGINYNTNGALTVENVTVIMGENVDSYAINFPSSADNATVVIKDSELTSRIPVNVWGSNMNITIVDTDIISVDTSDKYDYSGIQLNRDDYGNIAEGTTVTVTGGSITALNDANEPSAAVSNWTATAEVTISDTTVVTGAVRNAVAMVAGVCFYDLQSAIDSVVENNYNAPITLMRDIELDEMVTVPKGANITLNLDGKTITGTDKTSKNFSLIDNRGELTITGNGKMTLTATVNSGWGRYSAVLANNPDGKLVIENGTFEHLGGTDMAYGIDNLTNGKGTSAETVINGGVVKSTYRGIRQFLNGVEAQNILTINGGTVEGANKSVWMQDANANANSGTITVGENANLIGNLYLDVTEGSTEWPVEVSVAAAALAEGYTVIAENVPEKFQIQDVDGTYGVVRVGLDGSGTQADPYTINNINELKLFRDTVNAGNTYAGKYVKLTCDIDLTSEEWTPIGTSSISFNGHFDGDSHTISNLVVAMEGKSNAGFFGFTQNGSVSNLTFNNAKVTGRLNVGVVAGTPYTSKYTDINVTGHVEVNGMSYVGGVGGKNAYANWTDITVNVDENSYVKATSTENGLAYRTYVGGVIGFNGEGGHTFKNISSNIKVIGDVCDVGGIFGIIHYSNKVENVTCTATVVNTNPNVADLAETGGIAGVWYNEKGTQVTITNAAFTGTIETSNAPEEAAKLSAFGAAYNASNDTPDNSGKLVIDGVDVWTKVAAIGDVRYTDLAKAVEAAVEGDTITVLSNITLEKSVTIENGKKITLDLNGKTISGTHGTDYSMIHVLNGAELTVKDTTTEKNGKITYAAGGNNIGAAVWVEGKLILESGTIEVTDSWSLGFAVDLRPNAWGTAHTVGASFVMNGGTVKSTDTAVRVASNSSDSYPELGVTFTMNAGSIESTWDAIFVQHLYVGDLNINVENGTVSGTNSAMRIYGDAGSDIDMIVTGGAFEGDIKVADAYMNTDAIAISGGTFDVDPSAYCADGYQPATTADGKYTVVEGTGENEIYLNGDHSVEIPANYINADTTINLEVIDPAEYTTEFQGFKAAAVLRVTGTNSEIFNSEKTTKDITVTIPYKTGIDKGTIILVHDGAQIPANVFTYDNATGIITVKVAHFSDIVVYEANYTANVTVDIVDRDVDTDVYNVGEQVVVTVKVPGVYGAVDTTITFDNEYFEYVGNRIAGTTGEFTKLPISDTVNGNTLTNTAYTNSYNVEFAFKVTQILEDNKNKEFDIKNCDFDVYAIVSPVSSQYNDGITTETVNKIVTVNETVSIIVDDVPVTGIIKTDKVSEKVGTPKLKSGYSSRWVLNGNLEVNADDYVTANGEYVSTFTALYEVEVVNDYVSGFYLILVRNIEGGTQYKGFKFDGNEMPVVVHDEFEAGRTNYANVAGAWVVAADKYGYGLGADDFRGLITTTEDANYTAMFIDVGYDVNGVYVDTDIVDIADAYSAYRASTANEGGLADTFIMIASDVDGNRHVNNFDANEILKYYKNITIGN